MKTLADIKRRAVTGARLLLVAQTGRPELADTIRTIIQVPICSARPPVQRPCYDWESDVPGDRYCTRWPKAGAVRIIDADTFEYDLRHPSKGGVIRLRFLP